MILLFFILMILICAAMVVQEFLPALDWLHGARIYLTPVLVMYGALALPFPLMLLLAFWAGLFWDALHVQFLDSRVEFFFGWTIILYAALGCMMQGLRPWFLKGRWEIHCLASGFATSFILMAEYLMINFRRTGFEFAPEVWWRIGGPGLVALLLAPVFYLGIRMLENSFGIRRIEMGRGFD